MTVIMLAAGTSSRMGRDNKMLLPFCGMPMVTHCCMQALSFLEKHSAKTGEPCTLVVVTGYKRLSVEKALRPCRDFIGKTGAKIGMIVVKNPDYRKGQFTSAKTGVAQIEDDSAFFISLADMPLIKDSNYEKLVPLLEGHDAVRPLCLIGSEKTPGHPVLHSSELKQRILGCPDDWTVSRILRMSDTAEPAFDDPSWAADVDDAEAYQALLRRTF